VIRGLDGEGLKLGLIDMSAGIVHKEDGSKVLVFIDPPTGIQFHIPMTDEQEQALHNQWHEKHVIIAGADEMPSAKSNGHRG